MNLWNLPKGYTKLTTILNDAIAGLSISVS